jgi:hypothetical protein
MVYTAPAVPDESFDPVSHRDVLADESLAGAQSSVVVAADAGDPLPGRPTPSSSMSVKQLSTDWQSTTHLLHVERTAVFGVNLVWNNGLTPVDFVVQVHPDPVQDAEQDVSLRVIFRTAATDATAATEVEVCR